MSADLPYGGTAGWSGSDTSRDRAERERDDGTVTARQRWVLSRVGHRMGFGLTVRELREETGWHHGQASGVLSVLHKSGRLARLTETRMRCKVYVLPKYVNGRETEPHGDRRSREVDEARQAAERISEGLVADSPIQVVGTSDLSLLLAAIRPTNT